MKLATRGGAVELPHIFADPIAVETAQGDVSWEHRGDQTTVRVERLDFGNHDLAGTMSGQYRTAAKGPGEIDLTAQLMRADVSRIHRYVPRATGEAVRDWLRTALTKGRADDVRLRLSGKLADFPFADGKNGRFSLVAKGHDVTLDYVKGWPLISDIEAELHLDGAQLGLDMTGGRIFDVPLAKVRVEMKDLRATFPLLHIDGEAAGPTGEFLRFIDSSPVAGWTDHFTAGTVAGGHGHLQLKLDLPLGNPGTNKVAGEYQFVDNELHIPGVPSMAKVNGKLAFTEHELHAPELSADILGGSAKLAITGAGGKVHLGGTGTATLAALTREYELAYSDLVAGSLGWTLAADMSEQGSTWVLASNMTGSVVDLPLPVGKTAAESVPLRVERRATAAQPGEDLLTVDYGGVGRLVLHRRLLSDEATVDRALLLLGRTTARGDEVPDRPGLWVRGELAALNIDDWLNVRQRAKTGIDKAGGGLELAGTDIDVGVLDAFGRKFHDMKVAARRAKDDWRLDLYARELAGYATWAAPNSSAPNGRIAARLARFTPPDAGTPATWKVAAVTEDGKAKGDGTNPWPAIDIQADSYLVHGRDIGRLDLDAHPSGADWRIEKLTLTNEGGQLAADGSWQVAARRQQTKLDVVLDVKDAGAYLSRLGYPDAIKNGPTKVTGVLEWVGAPSDFDYPTLAGEFRIEVGPGRFTKIEPGMGKLLGVLSLQSLPKRLTLDFTDVFSEGFAFEEITGDVAIQNGVMRTKNLRLNGPAAKVDISGETDLAKETQQLAVRVQPTLTMGVSATAALLFLANPILGAAVGAGSLLAQKVLRDPIEQMFSYEYLVTGSWSDPIVARRRNEPRIPVADAPTK